MRGEMRGEEEAVRRTEAEGRREVRREAVVGRGAGFSGCGGCGGGAVAAGAGGGTGVGVVEAGGGAGEGERLLRDRSAGGCCCCCAGSIVCGGGCCSGCGLGVMEDSGGIVSEAEMGVWGVDFSRRSSSS